MKDAARAPELNQAFLLKDAQNLSKIINWGVIEIVELIKDLKGCFYDPNILNRPLILALYIRLKYGQLSKSFQ